LAITETVGRMHWRIARTNRLMKNESEQEVMPYSMKRSLCGNENDVENQWQWLEDDK